MKITFDKNAVDFVLGTFNKKVNNDGYIVEKNNESVFSLNKHGEKVHIDSFVGIGQDGQVLDNSSIANILFD